MNIGTVVTLTGAASPQDPSTTSASTHQVAAQPAAAHRLVAMSRQSHDSRLAAVQDGTCDLVGVRDTAKRHACNSKWHDLKMPTRVRRPRSGRQLASVGRPGVDAEDPGAGDEA